MTCVAVCVRGQASCLDGDADRRVLVAGHETPFSIKVSHLREVARSRGTDDSMTLAQLSAVVGEGPASNFKCEFILKQKKSPKHHSQGEFIADSHIKNISGNVCVSFYSRLTLPVDKPSA